MKPCHLDSRPGIFLLFLSCIVGCGSPPDWLSVDEVRDHAFSLAGQQVRVRGYMNGGISQSLIGCSATDPCCNSAVLRADLMATPFSDPQAYLLFRYLEILAPFTNGPVCTGNECSLTCSPFDPQEGKAYEFTGILHVKNLSAHCPAEAPPDWLGCQPENRLFLTMSVDLAASSELVGDAGLASTGKNPIPTGTFTRDIRTP